LVCLSSLNYIYAGGDDVLALVPADTALDCARFLRAAYRGQPGFIADMTQLAWKLRAAHEKKKRELPSGHREEIARLLVAASEGRVFLDTGGRLGLYETGEALDLPGEIEGLDRDRRVVRPDTSVGLAVAHFKNPLQDVIREAQSAEKRAKRSAARGGLDRSALAVTLLKRSGERVEWGCKWDSGGLDVYQSVHSAIQVGAVSAKFPHRLCELLEAYLTETSPLAAQSVEPVANFPVIGVLLREFRHVLDRQGQDKQSAQFTHLEGLASDTVTAARGLNVYLRSEKQRAETALADAKKTGGQWPRLDESERRRLERAPSELPVRALIGLMKTAAFTQASDARDGDESKSS
jgi:CRISPR-associated protein Cmr2